MKIGHWFIAAVVLVTSHTTLQAQANRARQSATVQAYGEHIVELTPDRVRLMFIAKAEGASAKEAVERLAKHKEAVQGELKAMKAEADSIKVTSSEIRHHTLGVPTQYQNMSAKLLANMLVGAINFRLEDLPSVHTASCVFEADWILPSDHSDLILQLPNSLREQVEQRDLIGDDNGIELSPEQAANIEKVKAALEENMGGFYDDGSQETQEVQVLFVANVKAESRAAALKAAFQQAREECELLAVAASQKLGRLVSLTKNSYEDSNSNFSMGVGANLNSALSSRLTRTTGRQEVISDQADALQARFQVRATFEME